MAGELRYWGNVPLEQRDVETRVIYTSAAGQTSYAAAYKIGFVDVYLNGAKLDSRSEFTATDGVTITLSVGRAIILNEIVEIIGRRQVPISDSYTKVQIDAKLNNFVGISTGTGDAGVVATTNSTAYTLVDGVEVKVRWFGPNTTLTPTIAVNGGSAIAVRQGGGLNVPIGSLSANQELTLRYNSATTTFEIVTPGVVIVPTVVKRQTVMTGPVDANSAANEIGVGTGLLPVLNGSVTPVVMTFASGFGVNGNNDSVSVVSTAVPWPTLPANALSFLSVDRNANSGALTLTNSPVPPQYGTVFDQTRQSLLHFEGANNQTTTTDDYGNTITLVGGAKLVTAGAKFGTASLQCGVSGSYAKYTNNIIFSGPTGWTIDFWANQDGAQPAGARLFGFSTTAATNNGSQFVIASTTSLQVSQDGASTSTFTMSALVTGTPCHFVLTYDPVASLCYVYQSGIKLGQFATAVPTLTTVDNRIGGLASGAGFEFNGKIDEFRIRPYCAYPAGTNFTVPSSAATVEGDWFNTSSYVMGTATAASTTAGVNPTFTPKQRLYVGEALTGASTVSSVVSYAYNRQYYSGRFSVAVGTTYNKNHNLGVPPEFFNAQVLGASVVGGPLSEFFKSYYYDGSLNTAAWGAISLLSKTGVNISMGGFANLIQGTTVPHPAEASVNIGVNW